MKIAAVVPAYNEERFIFDLVTRLKDQVDKIVVIDDISTPICEILYVGAPFIIIETEFNHFNNKTKKKILALKKINILFEDPIAAGKFLNQNYKDLNSWWNKVIKSQVYLSLKKELLPSNSNKDLKKLIEEAT